MYTHAHTHGLIFTFLLDGVANVADLNTRRQPYSIHNAAQYHSNASFNHVNLQFDLISKFNEMSSVRTVSFNVTVNSEVSCGFYIRLFRHHFS